MLQTGPHYGGCLPGRTGCSGEDGHLFHGNGSPLAGFYFSNSLHFDRNDIIPGKKCRDFMTHVARRTDIDLNDMGKVRYIRQWMD